MAHPAPIRSAPWRLLAIVPALIGMTAVGLVACGGGGDNDGEPLGAVPATINAGNYKDAAATVADAAFTLADDDLLGKAGGSAKPSAARAAMKAFDSLRRAKGGAWAGTSNQSINCTGGGTVTFDATFTSDNASTVGDRFSITYNNCIDLQARTEQDGKLEFALTHVGVGDFTTDPAYDVRIAFTFTQLRTSDRNGTSLTDGLIELESLRQALRNGQDSLIVPRLETSFTPLLSGVRTWNRLQQFVARNTYTPTTTSTTLDGTVAGSDGLNQGSVTVVTNTPFIRAVGRYPATGRLTATGGEGSRFMLEAVNDTTARLSLDANGDGSYEAVDEVLWTTLW